MDLLNKPQNTRNCTGHVLKVKWSKGQRASDKSLIVIRNS